MLKEMIEKIIDLKKPEFFTVGNRTFFTDRYQEMNSENTVDPIEVNTLTSLVEYIKSQFDRDRKMLVHVVSATEVHLVDSLDGTNHRRTYVKSKAMLPDVSFDTFINREIFNIMLQANFCENQNQKEILDIISHMSVGDGKTVIDNGSSQEVVLKKGVELQATKLKEKYGLMPYRTFVEIPQPSSDFIFRVKENDQKDIFCGIFEADGGAWKLNAMHSIKQYLQDALSEECEAKNIYIIS